MSSEKCILCTGTNITAVEQIDSSILRALYDKRAGVSVDRFFPHPFTSLFVCKDCGLSFYSPQAIGDGEFYNELQKYPGYYMKEKSEFEAAALWINPTDCLLEIGSGSGNFAHMIKCKSYTGLEFSDQAIEEAKQKGIIVKKEDLSVHAQSNSEKYDIVCFFQVLEHVEHPGEFIQHALKCLKKGGRLILAVPAEDSFINRAVNFYLNMPPHHASRWTDHSLKKIADLFQLQLTSIFHERLNKAHVEFYSKTIIYDRFCKLCGFDWKRIDQRTMSKIFYGISVIISKFHSAFVKPEDIKGQSVMVVYTK
jgi:SAM-dependent methyltransferase